MAGAGTAGLSAAFSAGGSGMRGGVCRHWPSGSVALDGGAGGMRRAEADSGSFRPSTLTAGGCEPACWYSVSRRQGSREAQPARCGS